jgi:transcriptional regulator with GAF, ATPase, and Fis domain/predicted negative regulator of RcsB-dependent stress response
MKKTRIEVGAPEKEKSHEVEKLIRKAQDHKIRADYPRAIELYELAIEKLQHISFNHTSFKPATIFTDLSDCYSKAGANVDLTEFRSRMKTLAASSDKLESLARSHYCLAAIMYSKSQYQEALESCKNSLELLNKESGDKEEIGFVLHLMGQVNRRLNNFKEARRRYEDARSLFRILGDKKKYMMSVGNLGLVHSKLSDWTLAKEYFAEELEYSKSESGKWAYFPALINLGLIHLRLGEWGEARNCFDKASRQSQKEKNTLRYVSSLICQGMILSVKRNWDEAEKRYTEAMDLSQKNGYRREIAVCLEHFGQLMFEKGDFQESIESYSKGIEMGEEIAPGGAHASLYGLRAEAFLKLGKIEQALSDARKGIEIFKECRNRFEESRFHRVFGQIHSEIGDSKEAKAHFEAGINLLKSIGSKYELAKCLMEYGRFHLKNLSSYQSSKTALRYLSKAGNIAHEIDGADHLHAQIHVEEAKLRLRMGEGDSAIEPLLQAEALLKETNDLAMFEEVRLLMREVEGTIIGENEHLFTSFQSPKFYGDRPDDQLYQACQAIINDAQPDRAFLSVNSNGRKSEILFSTRKFSRELIHQINEILQAPESGILENGEPVYLIDRSRFSEIEELPDQDGEEVCSMIVIPFGDRKEMDGLLYIDRTVNGMSRPFTGREFKQILSHYDVISELIFKIQKDKLREEQKKVDNFEFQDIITNDPKFLTVLFNVQKFIRCKKILIHGESGTGKELVAKVIHRNGPRRDKPFITVNCAAFAETLLVSELFGHKKGSFTGAINDRIGLFEKANQGTIFLDEIDKMSKPVQESLLRVIENGEIRRVGESKNSYVDVVIICASSKNLKDIIDANKFHPELYYRICRPSIGIPPLRERRRDIPILVNHFIQQINVELAKDIKGITDTALKTLIDYSWPGNVRELIGVVEEAALLTDDGEKIRVDVLPEDVIERKKDRTKEDFSYNELLRDYERNLIIETLSQCHWNVAEASRKLRMPDSTLRSKIKTLGDLNFLDERGYV